MSGGYFDYNQYKISQIADDVEHLIYSNDDDTLDEWGHTRGYHFPKEIVEQFQKAVVALKIAYVYAHRIDYLLSGDDGEGNFLLRLEEELSYITRNETV